MLFDPYYVLYYAGFAFVPTERPIAFVLGADGTRALVVPRLEVEHAEASSTLDRVEHYLEYPGDPRAEDVLARTLADAGPRRDDRRRSGRLSVDPRLSRDRRSRSSRARTSSASSRRSRRRWRSSRAAEVALIRESVRWGNLAHRLLQRYTRVGLTETEVSQRASDEATFAMLDAIGEIYRAQSFVSDGRAAPATAGRSAATRRSRTRSRTTSCSQRGDVLVTGASAPVWGYLSELERTMVIGEPPPEQERMFDHMVALQDIAFDAIQPGRPCSDVDRAVRAYFDEHDLWPYWRHHTGPRDRPALPRGAVPRLRRPHGDRAGHGVHGRAGPLLARARRLSPLRHRRS